MTKTQVPAIEGWFTETADGPALIGRRGAETGSYYFPPTLAFSRNPSAPGEELEDVRLSRRGRVWSWTTNHYQPPEPYVSPDPFVPYAVAAVELEAEKMVVLGQVDGAGVEQLEAGQQMELVLGTLYEDSEAEYLVWKWRPA
jgi:uncharacterized OB-fold protein